jgi:hypothetical protein
MFRASIANDNAVSLPRPEPGPGPTDPHRARVLAVAMGELGQQDPKRYWSEVVEHDGDKFRGAWCGGFALWAIRRGLGLTDIFWEPGKGFCWQLPRTFAPEPGDVAYFDQPYQHHAIVGHVAGTELHTIDGNQAGGSVQLRRRPLSDATAFFSIQPLIDREESVNV